MPFTVKSNVPALRADYTQSNVPALRANYTQSNVCALRAICFLNTTYLQKMKCNVAETLYESTDTEVTSSYLCNVQLLPCKDSKDVTQRAKQLPL